MPQVHVWDDIARRPFFENAILLDVKHRSQGSPVKKPVVLSEESGISDAQNGESASTWVPGFLDDFALVASGAGGPGNVSAACMEIESGQRVVTIRVARNAGFNVDTLCYLEGIIRAMSGITPNGSSVLREMP